MRSMLFVPGDSERKMEKALTSGADVLILDLEDSVSAANKELARKITSGFLSAHEGGGTPALHVRVNALDTGLTQGDLDAVMGAKPACIMLPKAESGEDVARLAAMLRVSEAKAGIEDGTTAILPIITETPQAVLNAATYRHASDRLTGLTWGAEDLSAAIGARATRDAQGRYTPVFQHARTVTILAASAVGVAAVDTVYPNFRDEEGFRRDCIESERDGFTARMAIHPAQVPVINEVFTPSADAIEKAQRLLDAVSQQGDAGVIALDGEMVDRPHILRAERVLDRARAAGAL
ncbi:HpcH/HpaI aldolase/citrate lyase family protein [Nitratireductor basaltis]|uniref:HpcH/HpaI aldolase n=1 Tax=Nitratireductor basaltis TaxID=472175 RepID=A0A084UBA6_9HYPH|nr:CoA ester lyase [Nitratireductor basaltis]KFB10242.1 HpcH/HpaI aldolase [Nitratireductor basaltis]